MTVRGKSHETVCNERQNNMTTKHFLKPIPAFILALLLPLFSSVGALQVYNFEGLSDGWLTGQDGWAGSGRYSNDLTVRSGTGANASKGVMGSGTRACAAYRKNDSQFCFLTPTGTETNYILQFDLRAVGEGAFFTLGKRMAGPDPLIGPRFGYGFKGKFSVREAYDGPASTSAHMVIPGNWYRLRLRIDFTANGGEGAGSVDVLNLTSGEIEFTPEPNLQNVNLKISSRLGKEGAPAKWDDMFIRADRDTPIDNLALMPGQFSKGKEKKERAKRRQKR